MSVITNTGIDYGWEAFSQSQQSSCNKFSFFTRSQLDVFEFYQSLGASLFQKLQLRKRYTYRTFHSKSLQTVKVCFLCFFQRMRKTGPSVSQVMIKISAAGEGGGR